MRGARSVSDPVLQYGLARNVLGNCRYDHRPHTRRGCGCVRVVHGLCLVCAGTLAVVISIPIPIRVGLCALRLVRTELDAAIPFPDSIVNTEARRLEGAAEEEVCRDQKT